MLRRTTVRRCFGATTVAEVHNERMDSFSPGSKERLALSAACTATRQTTRVCPIVIGGKRIETHATFVHRMPSDHNVSLATGFHATPDIARAAVQNSLDTFRSWSRVSFQDRAAIVLKAAHLISSKYRSKVQAATVLGQSKNAWQAEIDCVAEASDFLRFNVKYAEEMYKRQPLTTGNSPLWNMTDYRPLEGFVTSVSPFNFTAIGVNLALAPVLMGNVVIWKPSPNALLSNYDMYEIFEEAGLPPGVINFVTCEPDVMEQEIIKHPSLAGVAFTGSTRVFNRIQKTVAGSLDTYRNYPRISGETGGKNFHLLHVSCDINHAVASTVRSAFEYQGQKCSACSRVYVPSSIWPEVKRKLVEATNALKVGQPDDFSSFVCAVIDKTAFDKVTGYISKAKAEGAEVLAGGTADASVGYFVQPTILEVKDPRSVTMREEIFGPVLTVYVYPDNEWEQLFDLVDSTTQYGLTGSIFARERSALRQASDALRFAAGNMYWNDKSTGAVVGQQPFGGGRGSGTNDKAGASHFLHRWVSPRTIKENFDMSPQVSYPHQLPDTISIS